MTDSNQWQVPGGSVPPITPAANGGTPQGAAPVNPAAQAGWTPPPKPGLIPLQPLTLGTILGAAFQVIRRNPRPTFGISLLINGIITTLSLLALGAALALSADPLLSSTSDDPSLSNLGLTGYQYLSTALNTVLSIAALAVLQGIISLEVARGTLGEKLRFRGLWQLTKGRIGALIGWAALSTSVVGVAVGGVGVGIVVFAISLGDTLGIVVGILLGLLALLAFAALGVWLGTKFSLVPSALVLERAPFRLALRRSWSLTRGYFWRTFGIQALVSIIISVVSSIVTTPIVFLAGIAGVLMNPNGDADATIQMFFATIAISNVFSALISAVTSVVSSATSALLYIDLRMRKEGLDLELSRFVEARQTGDTTVSDPYLRARDDVRTTSAQPDAAPANSPWA